MKKIISIIMITIIVLSVPTEAFALGIFSTGKSFLEKGKDAGNKMEGIIENSNVVMPLVNIGLSIAVVVAIVMGIFIGIKFMTSGIEGKVEIKAQLTPYVVSIVIIFAAWTIWNIVLNVYQNTFN